MRFLHLCDQNWVGMANAFVDAHRRHGHDARLVTLCENVNEFEEDICLHLPFLQGHAAHQVLKRAMNRFHGDRPKHQREAGEGVPLWEPRSALERSLFRFREELLWKPRIERAIRDHGLDEFDVYHLESGVGFYRDARFLREMKARGKKIVCYYLGTDLRDRGAIPAVREISDLDLTCEWDHLALDPDLRYFFIPFDASRYGFREPRTDVLRVCHAPRNRSIKGTRHVVEAVEAVRAAGAKIELDLVEGVTHEEALRRKRAANLLVDHVGEEGSVTGYGMNSLEALAMGIPCVTSMTPAYAEHLGEHPFLVVTPESLEATLHRQAEDLDGLGRRARRGREWVERVHGADRIVEGIYERYRERGWMVEGSGAVPGREKQ